MLHILRSKPARFPFLLLYIDLFVGTSSLDLIGGDRKLGKERKRTCSERPQAGNWTTTSVYTGCTSWTIWTPQSARFILKLHIFWDLKGWTGIETPSKRRAGLNDWSGHVGSKIFSVNVENVVFKRKQDLAASSAINILVSWSHTHTHTHTHTLPKFFIKPMLPGNQRLTNNDSN